MPRVLSDLIPRSKSCPIKPVSGLVGLLGIFLLTGNPVLANIPGGGTGTGPNVTLTDNGTTVTLANGIVSIVITKTSAEIHTINYCYNNSGSMATNQLLSGGNNGGLLYWFQNGGTFIAGPFTQSVVANDTNYAEISLSYASPTNGVMDIHYSMLRGSPGFYTTAILTHRGQDGITHIELRPNIYAGSQFNWMSVDAARNRLMQVSGGSSVGVDGAPVECSLWTSGIYSGQYEDKYKYSADLAGLSAWGWSSVGSNGSNVGLWNITASPEYYPAGPMERSLMEHIGTTILNVFTGGYYGLGTDDNFVAGELWSKVYGPYFYYCNNVTNTITSTNQAATALYNDALSQGVAEQSAWPYSWFTNANYIPASGRGTIAGTMAISDSGNPNASAAGLWVGVAQQPVVDVSHDFQEWAKPYQFWVKTDTNGNFTIPDVIAGANYRLFAFGPGAAGTFMSQTLMGGNPPLLYDLPTSPFNITVTAGATNSLGTKTWMPSRTGATVFEIGYPDRTAAKFRHGDDYWVGDIGPSPAAPSPIWSKWLEYPFDFPNGVNYTVGLSRWSTDWNFIQPVVNDSEGNYNNSSSTITFNLATAPTNGAQASIYLGLTSDFYAAVVVNVNGNNLGSASGVTASPGALPTTGFVPAYTDSNSQIREGNNGAFTDERITFPASQLHVGANTITFSIRQIGGSSFADHAMYDYLRLELTGYVPPPPASVTAYAGNNANLLCWSVTPGATSYNLLRSTTSGSGYVSITNGVTGPVCGSGSNNATYLDKSAGNGATYYYVVRSVNPTGSSTNSPQSSGVAPTAGISTSAPVAPTGLAVGGTGHQSVTLNWNASLDASYYSVWRSTMVSTGGGSSNTLSTIILNNATTGTGFTDNSPTDGSIYKYFVTATSAGGTSGNSTSVVGVALPTAPASKPGSLTATFYQSATTNIVLNWNAVPGAVGYLIKRATSAAGPFFFLQSVTETVYYDINLNPNYTYYYQVIAMNAGGVSITATNLANGLQPAPASLSAVGDDSQIILSWPAAGGATGYTLKRGTSSGNETTTVVSGYAGLSYTNSGLINETTYYYVVTAAGAGGASGSSAEASATASAASSSTWAVDASGNWNTAANWGDGLIAFGTGNTANFSTINLTTNRTVILDSARTISELSFGDLSSSFNWTLAGTNSLTLGANPNIKVVNQSATISTIIAGSAGLTKAGLGTLILGGAAEIFTNGLAVNAGKLTLDFSATNSPATNIISSTNILTLGGGTLQIIGGTNVASSQTFVSTTLNPGGSGISVAPISGVYLPSLALGSTPTAPPPGATVRFIGPATIDNAGSAAAMANITTMTFGVGTSGGINAFGLGKNGYFATVGLYDWAATTGAGPYDIVGGSQVGGFYQTAGVTTGGNYDVNGSGANSIGNAAGASSVRFNQNGASSINSTAFTWQNCQGILVTPKCGANNQALTGNTLQFYRNSSPGSSYGVIWQNNTLGYLNISLTLGAGRQAGQDNGLVQAGSGTVFFSGVNVYGQNTYLNGGFSVVTTDSGFGAVTNASPVTLNGGTIFGNASFTMDNSGANARPIILGTPGGGLAAKAGNTMTIDGVVSGPGPLTIGIPALSANGNVTGLLPGSGPGTANTTPVYATGAVTLSNYNTFTGDITVNSGTLNVNLNNNFNDPVSGPLGDTAVARKINVNNGATLNFSLGNALGSTLTTVGATLVINSGGTVSNTANDIETLGPVQLNGGTLTGTGGAAPAFQMYDLRGTVTVGGSSPSIISGPAIANSGYHLAAPTIFNVTDVTGDVNSDLNVTGILVDQDGAGTVFGHLGAAGSLTKTGVGTMTLSATNSYAGGTTNNAGILKVNALETAGISGPLGKSGSITFGGGTLQYSAVNQYDYSGRFSAAANQFISIDTAGQNVMFTNSLTSNGGTLTKLGAGTLTLAGSNSYSGGTFISSGTLAVNNPRGCGTGVGNVSVQSGGSLTGAGTLGGFVTVGAGGRFMPGNPLGVLTISNNLFLASGSTASFQVQHSPLTNSAVKVTGTLTEDGTLTITNSGVVAFAAGDSFKLFSAAGYNGVFSSFNLPALTGGLFWNTTRLAVDGTLGVVSTNPPGISTAGLSGGNLLLQGTGGTPNWYYNVLSATNLTQPLGQWIVINTNRFDASGNFNVTNAANPNALQQFYILKVQ